MATAGMFCRNCETYLLLLAVFSLPNVISGNILPLQVDPSISENPNGAILETMEYLARYGYMTVDSWKAASDGSLATAVVDLQSFMDIEATGKLDPKTLETVRTPRCGLKDPVEEMVERGGTGAEITHLYGSRWNKTDLTFRIFRFPRNVKKIHFRKAIDQAFQLWSDVTPLTFHEVGRKTPADIDIGFYSGFHDDDFPFDGGLGVVGHTVIEGETTGQQRVVRIDVDADESFSFDSSEGINLLQLMAHQIGHALGLGHSSNHESIMSPCVKPYIADFSLSETDINGIQAIYGLTQTPPPVIDQTGPLLPSPIVRQNEPTYLCAEKPLDSVAVLAGEIYVFKGNRYWQFQAPNNMVSPVSGTLITERWPGLPSGLDAVYQRHTDSKAVFVKGGKMYIYDVHPKTLTPSSSMSPSTVSHTQLQMRQLRLPRSPDFAVTCPSWPKSTYFVKRGKVWHYSDHTETLLAGPAQLRELWGGVPVETLDAGFMHNDYLYFILGEEYWRFDHLANRVAPGFPRNFAQDFLGC